MNFSNSLRHIKDPFEGLEEEPKKKAQALMLKLTTLGFIATFSRVETGPIVSTFFFKPLPTSPLFKINGRTEDIAMSVGAESVLVQRMRDEIAISIPNNTRSIINFDSCLYWLATATETKEMALPLLMGQTTRGENFALDLAAQPHILIAGTTGGGKSVFLSQLITSLAVQLEPEELKLVLVDTKQLDLTLFNSLAHVIETVDKIEDLYPILDMLKAEVRTRTEKMKGIARNIKEYNSLNYGKKLPYIVLIIDELADVIGQDLELAKNETKNDRRTRVSASLRTLAQISRAAGIHIIAATQRPSAKIVDGDFKTNFPTRISFKLPSGTDSRVVLDEGGAENLLGKGDYLYRTTNDAQVRRAHGSFVRLEDIARIIEQNSFIREGFASMRNTS